MFNSRLSAVLLVAALLLAACGPAVLVPGDAQPLPSPVASQSSSAWKLALTQSGGFAGVNLKVTVSSDGRLIAENQKSGTKITKELDAATLDRLSGSVAALVASARRPRQPSACADCFLYDLQATSGSRSVHLEADDTTLWASGAQDLIALLVRLRDAALKG